MTVRWAGVGEPHVPRLRQRLRAARDNLGVKVLDIASCGAIARANSGPNPTAHLAGVGEGSAVLGTLKNPARLSARTRRRTLAGVAIAAAALAAPLVAAAPASAFVAPSEPTSNVTLASTHATAASSKSPNVSSALGRTKPTGGKAKPKAAKYATLSSTRILDTARKYDGGPYRYAGTTPSGFDCSGYTRYVFAKLGHSLPHNSSAQYTRVKHVSRAHARPGDLIFFRSGSGHIYHVGIFAGHGKLYHASRPGTRTGLGVVFSSHVSFGRV